ncbi:MAG: hypothetical protein IJH87_02960, partial [Atopobiaceae bacterium]|nr:hypothetical protein [Atopobiaceae bacterium]
MASTARAYAPKHRYEEVPASPQFEVHPGRGRSAEHAQYAQTMSIFRICMVVLALLAAMAVGRLWLTNTSMEVLTQTNAINTTIEEARLTGSELEVQYSQLTNPAKIKLYAQYRLGMGPAAGAGSYVDLAPQFAMEATPLVVNRV